MKAKSEYYRLNYRYQDYPWCAYLSLDKEALEFKKSELDKDQNYRTCPIKVELQSGFVYADDTLGSRFIDFIQGRAIKVGERHMDARCTGMRRCYALPEHEAEARAEYERARKGQETQADRYYNQPWV